MAGLVRKGVDSTVRGALIAAPAAPPNSVFSRAPAVGEIPEQGFVLATVAGTTYIYTRIGNIRYRVALTVV